MISPSKKQGVTVEGSALPPIEPDHGFREGDEVEMPLWGGKKICGKIEWIDVAVRGRRYVGLVLLGHDGRYYEFHPSIATLIKAKDTNAQQI